MGNEMGLRGVWLLSLVFFLSGCAGYHPARAPWEDPSPNGEFQVDEELTVGAKVKVTLTDGTVLGGIVSAMGLESFDIRSETHPEMVRTLARQEIRTVETKGAASPALLVAGGAVVAGILVATVVGLSNANFIFGD